MSTELFETFDDDGRATGLVARAEVHARGLWHASAHVFLFDGSGALYVQRRAADKDLFAGRWDLSVGEHLRPGERHLDGALRGLAEELGVTGVALDALGGIRRWEYASPDLGVIDRELQQAFRGRYDGVLRPDPAEVAEVRALPLDQLARWIGRAPAAFTPWFVAELNHLRLLPPVGSEPGP
jgi:isopentenyl-diphosphate Delta-isomerase